MTRTKMTRTKATSAKAREGPGIQAQTERSLKGLKAALRTAGKRPEKEDSIHDLRVSIRRFKQVLRVYSEFLEHTRKMQRSLRGLMDLCGAARDCDVALAVLESAGVPADHALQGALNKHRVRATRNLAKELEDWNEDAHLRRWQDWLTAKDVGKASPPEAPDLSREFRKAGVAAARAGAPYRQMHQFRLLVKKTRYASEILGAPQSQVDALRALQDRLGAINDCVTTSELIAELKLDASQQRHIRAALNRLAEKRSEEFRVYWRAHYGRKAPVKRGVKRRAK